MKKNKKIQFRSEKKKSKVLPTILIFCGLILTSIVVWVGLNDWNVKQTVEKISASLGISNENNTNGHDETLEQEAENDVEELTPSGGVPEEDEETTVEPERSKTDYLEGQELPNEPTLINDVLIANKQYPLPSTYEPGESVEAREAFNEMAAEALTANFNLTAFSTYRSYEYQVGLYKRYVERDGIEEADRYSARPGYSEHQTGLAFDIGEVNREQDWASNRFGDSEAASWLADNAHHYGFILRYPEGKEEITGYMHESWHYRYVGKEIAQEIYRDNLTLEEYLGL